MNQRAILGGQKNVGVLMASGDLGINPPPGVCYYCWAQQIGKQGPEMGWGHSPKLPCGHSFLSGSLSPCTDARWNGLLEPEMQEGSKGIWDTTIHGSLGSTCVEKAGILRVRVAKSHVQLHPGPEHTGISHSGPLSCLASSLPVCPPHLCHSLGY